MKQKTKTPSFSARFKTKQGVLFLIIFVLHLFFRFHELDSRNQFMWDQVDNAWAAKNIIVDQRYPLLGMVAKGNSGFYIGPAYYYLVAGFYYMTSLDPIASAFLAGATSIFTFLVLWYVTKKVFGTHVALVTIFIHTFSFHIIEHNRVQWPVNFIDPISLLIFYGLYMVMMGRVKYMLLLAIALGFSFHIHFTSIFYPLIILLSLPFFPRTKAMMKYTLFAIPLFAVWFIPNLITEMNAKTKNASNMVGYLNTSYHGLHGRRMLQVATDAFIEFESILRIPALRLLKYILLPVFTIVYYITKPSRERLLICYLFVLWFVIPWIAFSTYRGEISNYYFFLTRPFVLIILAYLTVRIFFTRYLIAKVLIVLFWAYYMWINSSLYFQAKYQGIKDHKANVKRAINAGQHIEFGQGDPQSYIYYIYTRE